MADLRAEIATWSIPESEPYKLRVTVLVEPLHIRETFYRVHEYEERSQTKLGKDEWHWFCWSMAGKPTVKVNGECEGLLNRMVMDHPDLSLVLHLFGYSTGDTAHV